jgi:uncharacterized protein (DUF1015 family)
VPEFIPFHSYRFSPDAGTLAELTAPPYDVLSAADVEHYRSLHPTNIVHVDVPREVDGPDRYSKAAATLERWIDEGVVIRDTEPSFTVYRMSFTDAAGRPRSIVGVLGGLEVVDEGAGRVLPHERTTPKASTDRLDLTRATRANLSPVWGLSLADGLSALLAEPGEELGSFVQDGVEHRVERIVDTDRVQQISELIASDDVLIADGHHRYGISRTYRDEQRLAGADNSGAAGFTLTFINELIEEQLSVEAIHRLYRGIGIDTLRTELAEFFDISPADATPGEVIAEMNSRSALCLVEPGGRLSWMIARPGVFDDVRSLDGAWLEHALSGTDADVEYQHGVDEIMAAVNDDGYSAGVLIRPVSLAEIERTAREGLLMPPKSTFFTPKLQTGLVIRPLD